MDPSTPDRSDSGKGIQDTELDVHTTRTDADGGNEGKGGLLMCPGTEPSTSSGGNYVQHATGKNTGINIANTIPAGIPSWAGAEDKTLMCTPPPRPTEDNSCQSHPVAQENQVGGVSGGGGEGEQVVERPEVIQRGTPRQGLNKTKVCSYKKGGVCVIHGPGAREHWRPIRDPVPGPSGKLITRQYYWVCPKEEIGPKGRGILRQSKLSFGGMRRQSDNRDEGDDSRRNIVLDSTTTGGT